MQLGATINSNIANISFQTTFLRFTQEYFSSPSFTHWDQRFWDQFFCQIPKYCLSLFFQAQGFICTLFDFKSSVSTLNKLSNQKENISRLSTTSKKNSTCPQKWCWQDFVKWMKNFKRFMFAIKSHSKFALVAFCNSQR